MSWCLSLWHWLLTCREGWREVPKATIDVESEVGKGGKDDKSIDCGRLRGCTPDYDQSSIKIREYRDSRNGCWCLYCQGQDCQVKAACYHTWYNLNVKRKSPKSMVTRITQGLYRYHHHWEPSGYGLLIVVALYNLCQNLVHSGQSLVLNDLVDH